MYMYMYMCAYVLYSICIHKYVSVCTCTCMYMQGREKLSKGGAAIYAVVAQHMYNRKFCQTNLQANKDARCFQAHAGDSGTTTVGEACHQPLVLIFGDSEP